MSGPQQSTNNNRIDSLKLKDFPADLSDFTYIPSKDGISNNNLLILLHGWGDNKDSLAAMFQKMALPQTSGISLRAPRRLKDLIEIDSKQGPELKQMGVSAEDLLPPQQAKGGYSWFPCLVPGLEDVFQFDEGTVKKGIIRIKVLLHKFIDVLCSSSYGFKRDRIFFFGFSQGAAVALAMALDAAASSRRFGGVIAISPSCLDPILKYHTTAAATTTTAATTATPILITHGTKDSKVSIKKVQAEWLPKIKQLLQLPAQQQQKQHGLLEAEDEAVIQFHAIAGKDHAAIASREEVEHVMRFLSNRLYLRNIALESMEDVVEIKMPQQR
eukprot:GEZU01016585.1.p1 GENE.GEZU01016585.1~~GEZU01016585.1.p1  ORF type:complete len:328 (+),score=103.22 GEZU01016585.1:561-1544(+)